MMKWKFKDKSAIGRAILALWIACNSISLTYIFIIFDEPIIEQWHNILINTLLANTFIGPFSLPKSFGDAICITQSHHITEHSVFSILVISVVFWTAVVFLLFRLYRSRLVIYFLIISVLMLIASVKWHLITGDIFLV